VENFVLFMPRTHFGHEKYIAETVDFSEDYRGDSSPGMKIAAPRYQAKETSQNETSSCSKREPLGMELRINCPPTRDCGVDLPRPLQQRNRT